MANDFALIFDELIGRRRLLQEFCFGEFDGITAFKSGVSFQVYQSEGDLSPSWAHHLSSTATCYEVLLACPAKFLPSSATDLRADARQFVKLALDRPAEEWTSDGSAPIYCRCRTLPLILKLTDRYTDNIGIHVQRILDQMGEPDRLAVGEAPGDDKQNWYPPNAYHTYWVVLILDLFQSHFKEKYGELQDAKRGHDSLPSLRAQMLLWAQKTAAFQVAMHTAGSPAADSDQLAWAIAIAFRFGHGFGVDVAQQDFLRLALERLFSRQNSVGIWPTGRPLFHYQLSGNAYCYVFETFTILLGCALISRAGAVFLREALKPYAGHLFKLWSYAVSTRMQLEHSSAFGWSSGHRPNRTDPESWATASVFSYANYLRRLFGVWTRETAGRELQISGATRVKEGAMQKILDRGDTWIQRGPSVAVKLVTLFVNPVLSNQPVDSLDPDEEAIQENQARGAILFGPPGTSKTTLAKSVAKAIGWDYIELHASHFVADGLGEVQRTADQIFKKLMQLDRTVILFDEIDELVREREIERDAFGRFLTTSMLPRLAELWKRRKVIYFVATNHIDYFDSAIIRAERFDAVIQVSPPSFKKKIDRLQNLVRATHPEVKVSVQCGQIEEALQVIRDAAVEVEAKAGTSTTKTTRHLPPEAALAKFVLIRWDQLEELAIILADLLKRRSSLDIDKELFAEALNQVSDPFLNKMDVFSEYLESAKWERRDFSKSVIWEVVADISHKDDARIRKACGRWWLDTVDFNGIPSDLESERPGVLKFVTLKK